MPIRLDVCFLLFALTAISACDAFSSPYASTPARKVDVAKFIGCYYLENGNGLQLFQDRLVSISGTGESSVSGFKMVKGKALMLVPDELIYDVNFDDLIIGREEGPFQYRFIERENEIYLSLNNNSLDEQLFIKRDCNT